MEEKKRGGKRPGAGLNKKIKVGRKISYLPDISLEERIEQYVDKMKTSKNRFLNDAVRFYFFCMDMEQEKLNNKSVNMEITNEEKTLHGIVRTVEKDGKKLTLMLNSDESVNMNVKMDYSYINGAGDEVTGQAYPTAGARKKYTTIKEQLEYLDVIVQFQEVIREKGEKK